MYAIEFEIKYSKGCFGNSLENLEMFFRTVFFAAQFNFCNFFSSFILIWVKYVFGPYKIGTF